MVFGHFLADHHWGAKTITLYRKLVAKYYKENVPRLDSYSSLSQSERRAI